VTAIIVTPACAMETGNVPQRCGWFGFLGIPMATSLPEISERPHGVIRNIAGKRTPHVWLIRHPWACCTGIGLLSFLFLLQGALRSWPLPSNMDEFSVLLAADTFRHGRITNPTPPLFEHFETLHVFFTPTYASKYPPAAALLLCFAERVFGDPIWALWLSTAFACAALTWMLLAWFPLRWALLGGFFALLHPLLVSWGRFYLCCNLGVLGAALLLGSAKRIIRRCTFTRGILLAIAVAILANVRPYEGGVLSLGVAAWLLICLLRVRPSPFLILIGSVLPVLLLTLGAMGYYNWRVTGSPVKMPYTVHAQQYDSAPAFWFEHSHPKWQYRHENLLNFHVWELSTYLDMQDPGLRLKNLARRGLVITFWFFDLSMIALLWIKPVFRHRSLRPVLLLSTLLLLAFTLTTWLNSNYISVAVPLYFIILTECLRQASRFVLPRTSLLVGPLLVIALAVGTFAWALQDVQPFDLNDSSYGYVRAQLIKDLEARGGWHVIFVRYSPQHPRAEEWIYNDADIPNAKIIWAHDMGPDANQALMNRFPGRQAWDFEADVRPQTLLPSPLHLQNFPR
jgi:hypothetical protein